MKQITKFLIFLNKIHKIFFGYFKLNIPFLFTGFCCKYLFSIFRSYSETMDNSIPHIYNF